MFVFVGGITASISINSKSEITVQYLINRIFGILIPYFIASLVYYLVGFKGSFNLNNFINYLKNFSTSPPMYYIAFYVQLIIISTLLFKIIKSKYNSPIIIIILILIYIFSIYLTKYTMIDGMALAACNIFGGTYLFVFSIGIFFYMWMDKLISRNINIIISIICMLGLTFFEYKHYILTSWSNPPLLSTIVYTLLIFGIVFSLFNLFEGKLNKCKKALGIFNYIGKNSLYIFLYHSLFITIAVQHNIFKTNNLFFTVWILFNAIIPPLFISYISKKYIGSNLKQLFFYKN
jgi:fucose 4-O-acetylase-like acetyltransferase